MINYNKKDIKIPYIFIDTNPSNEAKILYERLKKKLNINKLPYILEINNEYYIIIKDKKIKIINLEELIYMSNMLIIIECKYSKKAKEIVDKFLNSGIDIWCFPSSILNTKATFSNNLIRDGAVCITSEYMLLEYLKNIKENSTTY